MKLVILDLEFTQPTKKIIQIGAVAVDTFTKKIYTKFDSFVNPYEKLSKYIIDLTGIQNKDVENAQSLRSVLDNFQDWMKFEAQTKKAMAWGNDVLILNNLLELNQVEIYRDYDLKKIMEFYRSSISKKARVGLVNAMELFDLEFEGRQHNALVDSENTARLFFSYISKLEKLSKIEKIIEEK